ncbi:unnamed protein product [Amoebophrya sp. A120]|nr:unnamed protein product [Amoebophrya sp. A120]|eukprot:GSA120T00022928001.1
MNTNYGTSKAAWSNENDGEDGGKMSGGKTKTSGGGGPLVVPASDCLWFCGGGGGVVENQNHDMGEMDKNSGHINPFHLGRAGVLPSPGVGTTTSYDHGIMNHTTTAESSSRPRLSYSSTDVVLDSSTRTARPSSQHQLLRISTSGKNRQENSKRTVLFSSRLKVHTLRKHRTWRHPIHGENRVERLLELAIYGPLGHRDPQLEVYSVNIRDRCKGSFALPVLQTEASLVSAKSSRWQVRICDRQLKFEADTYENASIWVDQVRQALRKTVEIQYANAERAAREEEEAEKALREELAAQQLESTSDDEEEEDDLLPSNDGQRDCTPPLKINTSAEGQENITSEVDTKSAEVAGGLSTPVKTKPESGRVSLRGNYEGGPCEEDEAGGDVVPCKKATRLSAKSATARKSGAEETNYSEQKTGSAAKKSTSSTFSSSPDDGDLLHNNSPSPEVDKKFGTKINASSSPDSTTTTPHGNSASSSVRRKKKSRLSTVTNSTRRDSIKSATVVDDLRPERSTFDQLFWVNRVETEYANRLYWRNVRHKLLAEAIDVFFVLLLFFEWLVVQKFIYRFLWLQHGKVWYGKLEKYLQKRFFSSPVQIPLLDPSGDLGAGVQFVTIYPTILQDEEEEEDFPRINKNQNLKQPHQTYPDQSASSCAGTANQTAQLPRSCRSSDRKLHREQRQNYFYPTIQEEGEEEESDNIIPVLEGATNYTGERHPPASGQQQEQEKAVHCESRGRRAASGPDAGETSVASTSTSNVPSSKRTSSQRTDAEPQQMQLRQRRKNAGSGKVLLSESGCSAKIPCAEEPDEQQTAKYSAEVQVPAAQRDSRKDVDGGQLLVRTSEEAPARVASLQSSSADRNTRRQNDSTTGKSSSSGGDNKVTMLPNNRACGPTTSSNSSEKPQKNRLSSTTNSSGRLSNTSSSSAGDNHRLLSSPLTASTSSRNCESEEDRSLLGLFRLAECENLEHVKKLFPHLPVRGGIEEEDHIEELHDEGHNSTENIQPGKILSEGSSCGGTIFLQISPQVNETIESTTFSLRLAWTEEVIVSAEKNSSTGGACSTSSTSSAAENKPSTAAVSSSGGFGAAAAAASRSGTTNTTTRPLATIFVNTEMIEEPAEVLHHLRYVKSPDLLALGRGRLRHVDPSRPSRGGSATREQTKAKPRPTGGTSTSLEAARAAQEQLQGRDPVDTEDQNPPSVDEGLLLDTLCFVEEGTTSKHDFQQMQEDRMFDVVNEYHPGVVLLCSGAPPRNQLHLHSAQSFFARWLPAAPRGTAEKLNKQPRPRGLRALTKTARNWCFRTPAKRVSWPDVLFVSPLREGYPGGVAKNALFCASPDATRGTQKRPFRGSRKAVCFFFVRGWIRPFIF